MPGKAGQRIGGRNRQGDGRRIPHCGAQIVRVLPRPQVLESHAKRDRQIRPQTPGVFSIETYVPKVKVRPRQNVLLIEALNLALHKVRKVVAAGEELRPESRAAIGIGASISMEWSTGAWEKIEIGRA